MGFSKQKDRIHFLKLFYLFLAVLGLHCCAGSSLVATNEGYSLAVGEGLLTAVAFLIVEDGFRA